jgi:tetratricopeptide (TPR) repeat protein
MPTYHPRRTAARAAGACLPPRFLAVLSERLRDRVRATLRRPIKMGMIAVALSAATLGGFATPLPAQGLPAAGGVAEWLALGDRESTALRARAALGHYERALQSDGRSYEALWKASREAVDLGEFEPHQPTRDALYAKATAYARRAVAVRPDDADGYFHLARALGRTALALGPRERVKFGLEVREHALSALRLAPRHAGALHVMGVWNAEIMRLGAVSRAVAKTFLGGQVFGTASWSEAVRYLELAVREEPERLVHRLDLARMYRDTGRRDLARQSYQAALASPFMDSNDARYRQQADEELRALR